MLTLVGPPAGGVRLGKRANEASSLQECPAPLVAASPPSRPHPAPAAPTNQQQPAPPQPHTHRDARGHDVQHAAHLLARQRREVRRQLAALLKAHGAPGLEGAERARRQALLEVARRDEVAQHVALVAQLVLEVGGGHTLGALGGGKGGGAGTWGRGRRRRGGATGRAWGPRSTRGQVSARTGRRWPADSL